MMHECLPNNNWYFPGGKAFGCHLYFAKGYPGALDSMIMRICRLLCVALCVAWISGCAVVAVADAAVTVVATGVKVTAKAAGAVVDAVIPDAEEKKD